MHALQLRRTPALIVVIIIIIIIIMSWELPSSVRTHRVAFTPHRIAWHQIISHGHQHPLQLHHAPNIWADLFPL
jgi:hypothetical protein